MNKIYFGAFVAEARKHAIISRHKGVRFTPELSAFLETFNMGNEL